MPHTTLNWVLTISGLFSDCQGKACENGGAMDFNACACTCKPPTTTYVGPSCQCKYRLSKKLQISHHVRFHQILYFWKQAAIIQRRVIWIFFLILQYLIVPNCFIRTCTCLFIFFFRSVWPYSWYPRAIGFCQCTRRECKLLLIFIFRVQFLFNVKKKIT